jgi:hypothetical protein
MESSDETLPIVDNTYHTRQYLMCPHCSFHLCFEHSQKQIQNETFALHNQAKNLENLLNESQPVQIIIEQIFNSLNEWKEKMHRFIDQYSEQIQIHIERAQNRLDDQWNMTKKEYLQMLDHFILKPVDQLLQGWFFLFKIFFFRLKFQF